MPADTPELSSERIRAIRMSGLLTRDGKQHFDLLTEHVRTMLDVPVAIISIVDEDRQVFAGHCGLPEPWASRGQTPLSHSFCKHVVAREQPLIVADANSHPLVHENHAIGDLGVVAYLGVPVTLPTGEIVGALAAIDTEPREWHDRDVRSLQSLSRIVEREIALGMSELKFRSLFEDMQEGYYTASAVRDENDQLVDVRFEDINPAFEDLTGLSPSAVVGARLSHVVPDVIPDMLPAYDDVLKTGLTKVHANSAPTLGGRWYENRIRRLDGDRIASIFTDVTDRKSFEVQQEMLAAEMGHRLKNTIAMVQAIASQTLRPVSDRYHVEAFQQRLQALGSAHEILFRENWREATVEATVASFLSKIGISDRVDCHGPSVTMGERSTLSLTLLLHELATNAMKYGALSNETGRVDLRWALDGAQAETNFKLTWQEMSGPPVNEPSEKGFGSKLIRMGLTGRGGTVVKYLPDGLRAEMTAPLVDLQAS